MALRSAAWEMYRCVPLGAVGGRDTAAHRGLCSPCCTGRHAVGKLPRCQSAFLPHFPSQPYVSQMKLVAATRKRSVG